MNSWCILLAISALPSSSLSTFPSCSSEFPATWPAAACSSWPRSTSGGCRRHEAELPVGGKKDSQWGIAVRQGCFAAFVWEAKRPIWSLKDRRGIWNSNNVTDLKLKFYPIVLCEIKKEKKHELKCKIKMRQIWAKIFLSDFFEKVFWTIRHGTNSGDDSAVNLTHLMCFFRLGESPGSLHWLKNISSSSSNELNVTKIAKFE